MQYVNFVAGDDENEIPHCGPVAEEDAQYLRRAIATLRPLSDEDYVNGPAIILGTMARFSYVLDGDAVYWCVEWEPGLIIVRFSPTQPLAWTALRSPNPEFGGRQASDDEWEDYDEDGPNSQYTLVFQSWDAQFDAQEREWRAFVPAPPEVQERFEAALARANDLGEQVEQLAKNKAWGDRCLENLKRWCGKGIRLSQEEE